MSSASVSATWSPAPRVLTRRAAPVLGVVLLFAAAPLLEIPSGRLAAQQAGSGDTTGEERPAPRDPESFPRPTATATRTSRSILIDGHLDEKAWEAARPITGFIQAMPDAGAPATEETVVRILYDDRNLYVGAELLDREPEGIIAQFLEQEFETHDDDVFGITLDPFLDRRNSFMFLFNPRGAVKDGQTFDNSRTTNLAWEGVIHVQTSIHEGGWTLELAIPFTTLRFDPGREDQTWGMNLLRRIRRRNEDAYWAPLDRRSRVHTMELAGTLTGLSGLSRSRNLTLKPYTMAENTRGAQLPEGAEGTGWDGGMDLKYGITPRLTLDLTYRTDFSQVEVDQEQVNLTRFSLFFPEKRDFFIENAGIFAFGDFSQRNFRLGASPRDFTLFHSRRIGLQDGRPVPIVAGGRLTGQIGSFDVGLLNMQTESTDAMAGESFNVARVRRSFSNGLQIGALVASRDELGGGNGGFNRSYGLDANFSSMEGKLLLHSYLAATDYTGREGNNRATRISAAFRDRLWDVSALFREIGDGFRPGVGFVARRGIRHSYITVGAHPRPPVPGVNEINPYLEMDYITNLESSLETRKNTLGLGVAFKDGGSLSLSVADRYEAIQEPFRVAGAEEVPPGKYAFREGSLSYRSNAAGALSGEVSLSGGGFYQGDRRSVTLRGDWRPSHHMALEVSAQRNQIDFPETAFTADVFGARVDVAGSTRLFLSAFYQYNASTEDSVMNLRANFIHSPLSDLFLIYSERRNRGGEGLLERTLALKVTKLLSF